MNSASIHRNASTRAVVTGGTQGVGFSIAKRLAQEGAPSLVVAGRDVTKGERAAAELRELGSECVFVKTDVAVPGDCGRLMEKAFAVGNVNALVNAAGIAARSSLLDTGLEEWSAHFDTNTRGPFLLMQAFVKSLLKDGKAGTIVNIVSAAAHCGGPAVTPYSASKAALANLTKNVANAFAHNHIRCNGIMAGWMDTPGDDAVQRRFHGRKDGWQREVGENLPMGRLARPEELAGLATYMLSPESGLMTGALVDYDQHVVGA